MQVINLLNIKTRAELLVGYGPEYIAYEEAKCFFKLGDIVRLPNGSGGWT